MQAINRPFTQIIQGSHQFIIPVFQRDYKWTEAECEQLWVDIIRASESQDGGHFLGSIVYVGMGAPGAGFNSLQVIDGQQRLTTMILLLTALRDHIRETDWAGGEDSPTVDKIEGTMLKNPYEAGARSYKLALRRADNETLRSLIDSKEPTIGEASELVVNAYKWFRNRLRGRGCDPDAVYRGIGRLVIVDVTLDRVTDNPQLVFESLNSTGVDLSQSDLIRNYILMGLDESEQNRLYEEYWRALEIRFREASIDWFLRDYVALKTGTAVQPMRDRIYDAFKDFRRKDPTTLETLLQDMARFASFYLALISHSERQSELLSRATADLRALGTSHALLGMCLYDCCVRENPTLSEKELVQALRLIESYMVRRGVIGRQPRDYWSIFARVAQQIDKENPLETLKAGLARQPHFIDNDEFMREVQLRNLYAAPSLCKHILGRLENDSQNELSPVDKYSIEHIMPQDIANVYAWQKMLGEDWQESHEVWKHRLGNLTLVHYKTNSALSNKSFEEKKQMIGGFEQSAARLNRFVRNQEQWMPKQMQERGEMLARQALDVWPHHQADVNILRAKDVSELQARAARRDSGSLTMDNNVRDLLDMTLAQVHELDEVIVTVENRSVCCYAPGPDFLAELLPMAYYLRIILPVYMHDINVPAGLIARDTTTWKFVPNRVHVSECNMLIEVFSTTEIPAAIEVIQQVYEMVYE